ncbi:MAG: hypothetical protein CBB72_000710 [Muricauda sp. TMED12]|nr:MAG: hypothetical protein CBB72_000710 [Muricauda sp. TMED12]
MFLSIGGCKKESYFRDTAPILEANSKILTYDSVQQSSVMVLGVFHFGKNTLAEKNQNSIKELVALLKAYKPTKIVVEWEPERSPLANEQYQMYLKDSFDISNKHNEVYQLGFRLAKAMGHDSIFMFDDQTDYIGSLAEFATEDDPFSFELFSDYANGESNGFYNVHENLLRHVYGENSKLRNSMNLLEHITLLNSPIHQKTNAQRMHMYEVRVGIQKNWAGPDWLGRWYRRNVRMMANTLKMMENGDNLLLIVGDNHKWTLDMLFENTPDFKVDSSWDFLIRQSIMEEAESLGFFFKYQQDYITKKMMQ